MSGAPVEPKDPYLWLEELTSDEALDWVRAQNRRTLEELTADPRFEPWRSRFKGILDSKARIPGLTKLGPRYYNFWRDDAHPRGLWRRLPSLEVYTLPEPPWETVVDLDALAGEESESWVWHGVVPLYPDASRCLVRLSRGGADADVVRELDTVSGRFVTDGFVLPEAKSQVAFRDRDTVFVATDFGPGSLTTSGYPRQVKLWRRGTPLAEASLVFEGEADDVAVGAARTWVHGVPYDVVTRSMTFYTSRTFLLGEDGQLRHLEVPDSATVDLFDAQLLVTLRDDWDVDGGVWPGGSLLAISLSAFLAGSRTFTPLFIPTPTASLAGLAPVKSTLVVLTLDDVKSRAVGWTLEGGRWSERPVGVDAASMAFTLTPVEGTDADELWLSDTGFTLPTTLAVGPPGGPFTPLRQQPHFFDATGLSVTQHFATSRDGTRVPYFQVAREGLALTGTAPTLLTGYGGFEVALTPAYDALAGAAWLEHGGVLVVANIRGGGEYGPRWHQAALKEKRVNAFDDFIAVAEALVQRGVTTPPHLGISGGSNGGLLMGVMLTRRPDLFGAVVCQVPLLDMRRYSVLLAGASWIAEYGDPSRPEDWASIAAYSPYHHVARGVRYPRVLFTTSTRDDRVHPAHARKMAARLLEHGHDVLLFENLEGGHGGAADNAQWAHMKALAYTFLARQLGLQR